MPRWIFFVFIFAFLLVALLMYSTNKNISYKATFPARTILDEKVASYFFFYLKTDIHLSKTSANAISDYATANN